MTFKVLKNPSRDLPRGAVVKNPLGNAEDMGLVPALGGFHMPRGNEACGPKINKSSLFYLIINVICVGVPGGCCL